MIYFGCHRGVLCLFCVLGLSALNFLDFDKLKPLLDARFFKIKSFAAHFATARTYSITDKVKSYLVQTAFHPLGPQILNGLLNEMKSTEDINSFKPMKKGGMVGTVNVVFVNMCLEIGFILFS